MRRICRSAGNSVQKYAIEISLISVAIAGTGFITEAILAVEYIQATRLALIQAHPGVAFLLVLMSLVKCKYLKLIRLSQHWLHVKYTILKLKIYDHFVETKRSFL